MKETSVKHAATRRGQCRIIAGKFRGRIIKFDDADGLRPTTDRIRETVFNWLQAYLPQSRCLDCFAGSGVLGFEALSRGVKDVVFIEKNIKTLNNLKKNIGALGFGANEVVIKHEDALSWLRLQNTKHQFDLVFLDPPFHTEQLEESCTLLCGSGCLAKDAIIYVEHEIDKRFEVPYEWDCLKEKTSGKVTYKLFINKLIKQ